MKLEKKMRLGPAGYALASANWPPRLTRLADALAVLGPTLRRRIARTRELPSN